MEKPRRHASLLRLQTLLATMAIAGSLVVAVPHASGSAATAPVVLIATPGPAPAPVPDQDRKPVLSIPDEAGAQDPSARALEVPPGRPDIVAADAKPLLVSGGSAFNVYGVGPEGDAHRLRTIRQFTVNSGNSELIWSRHPWWSSDKRRKNS